MPLKPKGKSKKVTEAESRADAMVHSEQPTRPAKKRKSKVSATEAPTETMVSTRPKKKRKLAVRDEDVETDSSESSDDASILDEAEAELREEGLLPKKLHRRQAKKAQRDYERAKHNLDLTRKVFLGRCPPNMTNSHIYEHFKSLKDCVEHVFWPSSTQKGVEQEAGNTKRWCLVTFKSTSLAMQAAAMKPPVIDGEMLMMRWKGYDDPEKRKPGQKIAQMLRKRDELDKEEKGQWQRLWKEGNLVEPAQWTEAQLKAQPFKKDFSDCIKQQEVGQEELEEFIRSHKVDFPEGCPPPVRTFDEVDFGEAVNKIVTKKFDKPYPIQSLAWPILLRGRDCIGIAQTGSGKTLAYALPSLVHIRDQIRPTADEGPIVLILAPTRELILQITEVMKRYQLAAGIRVTEVYGGQGVNANRLTQAQNIACGLDVICGTPGRTIDFVESGVLTLKRWPPSHLPCFHRSLSSSLRRP